MTEPLASPAPLEDALDPYDAILLVSFGGPEKSEDVVPFLENVTRGRGIPRERLAEVGEHYFRFGGRSPINDQCRALLAALAGEFAHRGHDRPLYWGNRNWAPYLGEEMRRIEADGHRRVLAVITSAYPSYSSCRQYRENLYDAAAGTTLQVDRLRHYATHPGFVAAFADATVASLDELGGVGRDARLVFVTHSIPTAMAETSGPQSIGAGSEPSGGGGTEPSSGPAGGGGAYVDWHRAVAAEVTRQVNGRRGYQLGWDLTYCSRSGPPSQPWLEPDVNDHLRHLAADGVPGVVLVPIGFVSDHMEVIYDLDTEAVETADELGLPLSRAATAGVHPAFVSGLVDLMEERAAAARGKTPDRPAIPGGPVAGYQCPPGCCRNLRDPERPALCSQPPGELPAASAPVPTEPVGR